MTKAQLIKIGRDDGLRRGRDVTGLYPEISRTLLAKESGLHKSQVSRALSGKSMRLKVAGKLAKGLGISIERMMEDIDKFNRQKARNKKKKRSGR